MNLPPEKQSTNPLNADSNTKQNTEQNNKNTKKKIAAPKTHNHQFSMQSIIHSVAGIGVGSANDFSFTNINQKSNLAKPLDLDTPTDIQKSILTNIQAKPTQIIEEKIVDKKVSVQTKKVKPATNIRRSKKINKAKLQKVFKTNAFKKSNQTIKILPGLSKLINNSSDRSAREIVTELLIKWLMKEFPQSEPALLQLLDQHLNAE